MAEGNFSGPASILKTKSNDSKQQKFQNFIEKEDILCIKRKVLEIIESLSEEGVTSEKLLGSCRMLTKSDYADVVEERNILSLCGYPLCSNHVKIPNQQFHIVLKVNRVYDITERKRFCSNTCYKASCYLKLQLSEIAVWFQQDSVNLTLLPDTDNSGSMGELVPLRIENLCKTDSKVECGEEDWFTKDDKELLQEELSKCAEHFKNLEVTERRVQPTTTAARRTRFNDVPSKTVTFSTFCNKEKTKNSEISNEFSDAESDDNEYFPLEENINLSEKLMPVVRANKVKAILIDPDTKSVIDCVPISSPVSLATVKDILKKWITPDTLKFLLSGKLSDHVPPAISAIDLLSDKDHTPQVNNEGNTRMVLNKIEEIAPEIQNATNNNETLSTEESELAKTTNLQIELVKHYFQSENLRERKKKQPGTVKFKTGRKGSIKVIKNEASKLVVTPESSVGAKGEYDLESNSSATSDLTNLPKVDSISQDALRRQVVCVQLKNAFSDILPLMRLHYNVLGDTILRLVSTFRLTASNVIHKPKEWKLIAVVLLRLLMESCLIKNKISKRFIEEETFSLMLKKISICEHLSVYEIDAANEELFNCNTQLEKRKE